jgi:hypothetical protein
VAHTESTTALTAVQRAQNVVLEQTRHTIVGEALAQLDDGHQPGGDGQVLSDVTQRTLLILCGFLTVRSDGAILLVNRHIVLLVAHDDVLDRGVIVGSGARSISMFSQVERALCGQCLQMILQYCEEYVLGKINLAIGRHDSDSLLEQIEKERAGEPMTI